MKYTKSARSIGIPNAHLWLRSREAAPPREPRPGRPGRVERRRGQAGPHRGTGQRTSPLEKALQFAGYGGGSHRRCHFAGATLHTIELQGEAMLTFISDGPSYDFLRATSAGAPVPYAAAKSFQSPLRMHCRLQVRSAVRDHSNPGPNPLNLSLKQPDECNLEKYRKEKR